MLANTEITKERVDLKHGFESVNSEKCFLNPIDFLLFKFSFYGGSTGWNITNQNLMIVLVASLCDAQHIKILSKVNNLSVMFWGCVWLCCRFVCKNPWFKK